MTVAIASTTAKEISLVNRTTQIASTILQEDVFLNRKINRIRLAIQPTIGMRDTIEIITTITAICFGSILTKLSLVASQIQNVDIKTSTAKTIANNPNSNSLYI